MRKIPQTDSVAELARFWDGHDLTDFEDQLEEVPDKVFEHEGQGFVRLRLPPEDAAALHRIAKSRGVEDTELVSQWVHEKLHAE
jgi:hypothetical protein